MSSPQPKTQRNSGGRQIRVIEFPAASRELASRKLIESKGMELLKLTISEWITHIHFTSLRKSRISIRDRPAQKKSRFAILL
jgi:hypothetical protein